MNFGRSFTALLITLCLQSIKMFRVAKKIRDGKKPLYDFHLVLNLPAVTTSKEKYSLIKF